MDLIWDEVGFKGFIQRQDKKWHAIIHDDWIFSEFLKVMSEWFL